MFRKRAKPGKRSQISFSRKKIAAPLTRDERAEADRLVREFLSRRGATKCAPGWSRVDL